MKNDTRDTPWRHSHLAQGCEGGMGRSHDHSDTLSWTRWRATAGSLAITHCVSSHVSSRFREHLTQRCREGLRTDELFACRRLKGPHHANVTLKTPFCPNPCCGSHVHAIITVKARNAAHAAAPDRQV